MKGARLAATHVNLGGSLTNNGPKREKGRLSAVIMGDGGAADGSPDPWAEQPAAAPPPTSATPEQIAVFEAQVAFLEQTKLVEEELEATIKAIMAAKINT